MRKGNRKRQGKSYVKRVADINMIYDNYAKTGLTNREIWKRYIYPRFGLSERTFYNLLKAQGKVTIEDVQQLLEEGFLFPELQNPQEDRHDASYYKKNP